MVFIMDHPRIQKCIDSIFVVVDRLTKVDWFIPTMTIMIALGAAELFVKEILMGYGSQWKIHCYKDINFVSEFWF